MNNIITKTIAASAVLAGAGLANAELVHIDFNDLEPGVMVTDQYEGVRISLLGGEPGEGPVTRTIPADTYIGAGGIAIRPSTVPGTTGDGPWSDLHFIFDEPTEYFSLLALDAEEPVSATAWLGDEKVAVMGYRGGTNFQVWDLTFGEVGGDMAFDRVIVDLVNDGDGWSPGPEIFDNLRFTRSAVPTPGAVTLLASSGVLAMRRRRIEA